MINTLATFISSKCGINKGQLHSNEIKLYFLKAVVDETQGHTFCEAVVSLNVCESRTTSARKQLLHESPMNLQVTDLR